MGTRANGTGGRPRRLWSAAILGAVGLPLAACNHTQSPKLTWGACSDAILVTAGLQCTTLKVPLDYGDPKGATVTLALSRLLHTVPNVQPRGAMILAPDGPGAAGIGQPALVKTLADHGSDYYDWIGFDPRGVGASTPLLSCDPAGALADHSNVITTTPAAVATRSRRAKRFAAACATRSGALLQHATTADSARDVDSIRRALGVGTTSFYGRGYGTYLGSVWATMFPKTVDKLVLDGVVNPTRVGFTNLSDQAPLYEQNLTRWLGWIATNDATYHLGTTLDVVRQRFDAARDSFAANPPPGGLGTGDFTKVFLIPLTKSREWPTFADILSRYLQDGNTDAIRGQAEPTGGQQATDDRTAADLAAECGDSTWPAIDAMVATTSVLAATAPLTAWSAMWHLAPCASWTAVGSTPVTVDLSKVKGALLINGSDDAATPFAGALNVRVHMPKSRLVEVMGGIDHASSFDTIDCVSAAIADYIISGDLPPAKTGTSADVVCNAAPDPKPA